MFSAIEILWDDEAIRHILLAQRKSGDFPSICPLACAVFEVCPPSEGTLVAFFGGLGQQLHDDPRQWLRDRGPNLARGIGRLAIWLWMSLVIIGTKGRATGQQFVEGNPRGNKSPCGNPPPNSSCQSALVTDMRVC